MRASDGPIFSHASLARAIRLCSWPRVKSKGLSRGSQTKQFDRIYKNFRILSHFPGSAPEGSPPRRHETENGAYSRRTFYLDLDFLLEICANQRNLRTSFVLVPSMLPCVLCGLCETGSLVDPVKKRPSLRSPCPAVVSNEGGCVRQLSPSRPLPLVARARRGHRGIQATCQPLEKDFASILCDNL